MGILLGPQGTGRAPLIGGFYDLFQGRRGEKVRVIFSPLGILKLARLQYSVCPGAMLSASVS